jgi:tetratricopeptide (TPR) repeat protein
MFWKIANAWAPAYNEATSGTDMGIPLRLSADFNERSVRASVRDSYLQAIADLRQSASLLPIQPLQVVRGSRPAAFAFLSRVYLSMRQYDAAGRYADSCLQLNNKLVDYNTLNPGDAYPIPRFNEETLVYSYNGPTLITTPVGKVDSLLYQSYDNADLRKTVCFKDNGAGRFGFKGSYSNSQGFFAGVATDEVYLNRAECYARSGNVPAALADLNTLLQKRYKTGQFIPVTATSSAAALAKILIERRKELLFRFIRWMDLKRFNLEGANITLTRVVHGTVYTLSPNDLRYALPIPEDIIALTGMPQNPR